MRQVSWARGGPSTLIQSARTCLKCNTKPPTARHILVYALESVGTFCTHPNLYLQVHSDGARRWSYRFMHQRKAHEIGLGALPYVQYDQAVRLVETLREWRDDPVETRLQARRLMRQIRSKRRDY